MSVFFHFTLILLKLEHALMTPDSLNQNQTKKVMLLYVGPCQSNGSFTACRMKMPYFISYDEYLELIYKKPDKTFVNAFRNNVFG